MKKNLLFVIVILNLIGCSVFQVEEKYEDPRLKNFKYHYQKWELDRAKEELDKLKDKEKFGNEIKGEKKVNIKKLYQDIELRRIQKNNLKNLLVLLKDSIKENDFKTIEKHINNNLINKIKLNQLKKYDWRNTNIFIGKIDYYKDRAKTIIVFNYIDQSIYYNFEFKLENGKWILEHYEERG